MKNKLFYSLFVFFTCIPLSCWPQADSLKTEMPKGFLLYSEVGGGWNTRGLNGTFSITMTTPRGLGGSVSIMGGFVELENIPEDYYSFFGRWSPPVNDFTILSFNLVKKFTASSGYFRFGLEAGPSWTRYNLTTIELNPYWPDLFEYKYNKFSTIKNSAGLTMAIKAEIPFVQFMGCNVTLFTNINSIISIVGFDMSLQFGKVGEKRVQVNK
jgi:hypothetical protein